ncbi:hypothetical protein G7Y79_00046g082750 [Physcia stellaris]|nr:hypothetical protein G7Y79_00046g082750 [Physcia stellaris]
MHCPEEKEQARKKAEILKAKQRLQVLRQRRAQREAIEAARPIPTPRDIGIFDPTLICDIQEFNLYSQVTGFLQHLEQCQHQYRKSDVLDLFPKCLRGPAFAWFNSQSSFTTIQDFGKGLACAFPTISKSETIQSTSPTPPHPTPSIEYHSCVECSAHFSSMSRLLQHTQYHCTGSQVTCKHCDAGFNSKNKLHDHIREYHAQKPVTPPATSKNSHLPIATLNITPKQAEIAAMLATRGFTPKRAEIAAFNCPLAPPPTPPASISPECSHLPIATPNITPKSMEKLPANSLTPPVSPPQTPVPKHQKSYLTIDDLIRMFHGKPRPFSLRQHQKGSASPQHFGTSPPRRSRSSMHQSRITSYFMPAANQKAPISQGLKTPNPKSFQQHTPAEPIRPASALPEKSAFSPYKKPGISYTSLQSRSSFLQSRSSFAWPPPTSPPFFRSLTPDHVCCTCFGHSSFRNGLFNYPSPSQPYPSNRRPMRGVGGMVSRFGAKLGGNGG